MSLIAAMEATWPPARRWRDGPWLHRDGAGGGKRVSASTLDGAFDGRIDADLYMLRPDQGDLDGVLAAAGFRIVDPTVLYAAPVAALAGARERAEWPPRADVLAVWAAGGLGPERVAVMDRAQGAKAAVSLPGGAGFVALAGATAMLHALEVAPEARRRGLGRRLLQAAAGWAQDAGAETLGLAVTEANIPARALYAGCGMAEAGRYHYRQRS